MGPITESDLITTKGVTSDVRGEGHVLLLDYDEEYRDMMDEATQLPGVTVVFESSPGSFHAWNLTIRTLEETALTHLSARADPNHAAIGYRRGRWTLRVGSKDVINSGPGEHQYKDSPTYYDSWVNRTNKPQSTHHLSLALGLVGNSCERETIYSQAMERCRFESGGMRVEKYVGLTDEGKDKVNGK